MSRASGIAFHSAVSLGGGEPGVGGLQLGPIPRPLPLAVVALVHHMIHARPISKPHKVWSGPRDDVNRGVEVEQQPLRHLPDASAELTVCVSNAPRLVAVCNPPHHHHHNHASSSSESAASKS